MRVLEVISNLKPVGGGETFAVNFSRCMNDICELKVVILYKDYNPMFINRLKEKNIDYVILDKKKHFDLKNAKELRRIIIDFKPDFIHTENNALIPTYLALRFAAKKIRLPVFHTLHLIPREECSNKLVKILYKHIFGLKEYIPVAISDSLAIETAIFFKKKKVPFIKNGIDLERINDKHLALVNRDYDAVVVGRFSYPKNHEFLIKAFSEIKKRRPSFKAAFIGGGELFDKMQQLAKDSGGSFIEFMGIMENPSIVLHNSKIVALGSRYEANPLSLLEGMASGCIVVSTDVGGIKNIIKPENGFLYDVDDDSAFIDIILKVLRSIEEYEKMSLKNVEYTKSFSMEKCAREYLDLMISTGNKNED